MGIYGYSWDIPPQFFRNISLLLQRLSPAIVLSLVHSNGLRSQRTLLAEIEENQSFLLHSIVFIALVAFTPK